jgi:SAM-dependent methyltransferase
MTILAVARRVLKGGSLRPGVRQTICWGTKTEARRLGRARSDTRWWAHAWIRCHMEDLPLSTLRVLDAGSGLSNRLLDWYRPKVQHAYLVEFLVEPREVGNTTFLQADLEQGIPLPDESVELVTSCSSIEHLSANGQVRFLREAQRILRPGGFVIMTFSYIFGLDPRVLEILARDPVLAQTGCTISARPNLRAMLEAAPKLHCPEEPRWDAFPGFEDFSEKAILDDPDIIHDSLGSYGDVHCMPQTDALALKWSEIGIYLIKR